MNDPLYISLINSNTPYPQLAREWVRTALDAGVTNYIIFCADEASFAKLISEDITARRINVKNYDTPSNYQGSFGSIPFLKLVILEKLLEEYSSVVYCDVDAFIHKDPSPVLSKLLCSYDVLLSTVNHADAYPKRARDRWKFSLCSGWMAFKRSPSSFKLIQELKKLKGENLQLNLNDYVLKNATLQKGDDNASFQIDGVRLKLLDQSLVSRSKLPIDSYVYHCLGSASECLERVTNPPIIKIAHIFCGMEICERHKSSYLHIAQPITCSSMSLAKSSTGLGTKVDLYIAHHKSETVPVPPGFAGACKLNRSAYETTTKLPKTKLLPLLGDIIHSLYEASDADYFIITNADIGVFPDFYDKVSHYIKSGLDGFCINRRTMPKTLNGALIDSSNFENLFSIKGKDHPGIDCGVFKRSSTPSMNFGKVFLGYPPVGQVLLTQIRETCKNFKWIKDEFATFHLGDDQSWSASSADNDVWGASNLAASKGLHWGIDWGVDPGTKKREPLIDLRLLGAQIKKEDLDVGVVSCGGCASNSLVDALELNGLTCRTPSWERLLCHCPTFIDVDIPLIYVYRNPFDSFLSIKRRGGGFWNWNQWKLSNDLNIELSDENLLRLIIKQIIHWTSIQSDNLLVLSYEDLFKPQTKDKIENLLGVTNLKHLPLTRKPTKTNVKRFTSEDNILYNKYKNQITNISPPIQQQMNKSPLNKINKCFYINLNRRPDRLAHINKTLPFFAERVAAIDGETLELTPDIKDLFPNSYTHLKKAEIACSLSHYSLWKRLVLDKECDNYLILEDDVVFKDGFVNFWNQVFNPHMPEDFSLIYLGGCQPWNKPHYPEVLSRHNDYFCTVKKNDYFKEGDHYWHMNAQSYIISKQGASLICQWIEQNGFDLKSGQAQDVFMINFFCRNKLFSDPGSIYHLNPLMSYQLHEENNNPEIDKNSDLRFAEEKFAVEDDPTEPSITLIWQIDKGADNCYERDWIRELFGSVIDKEVNDGEKEFICDNSIIVYSDMFSTDPSFYPESLHPKLDSVQKEWKSYWGQAKDFKNCSLIHLSDEFCHADTSHYGDFKHVFRNYFREDSALPNVTFLPLGYKRDYNSVVPRASYNTDEAKVSPSLGALLTPMRIPFSKKRYGQNADGGYVFAEELFDKSNIVYSYGISDEDDSDSFDLECAILGKNVFMYDGTISKESYKNPLLTFKKENLTSGNLQSHIQENNHSKERSMVLKMDIEGCEYEVINNNSNLIYHHFELVSIEFHGLNNPSYYNFKDKSSALKKLLQYYDIYHMHGNNWIERKFEVPNVLEISFIRKGHSLPRKDGPYPIEGLDFSNCPDRPDYKLDWWLDPSRDIFPFAAKLPTDIPKKIHLSWKNKGLLNINTPLVLNGVNNLARLNPDWDIEVNDDEDINKYLRDNIGEKDYELIKDKKMVEKTDLWRLLKVYNNGGLYIDIDRYVNVPLADLIASDTRCVLPTYRDVDFSQDFLLSVPENPLYEEAIYSNLYGRRDGKSLFYLAVESYMRSITNVLSGRRISREPGILYWNEVRPQLNLSPYFSTFREETPFKTILFNFDKDDFVFTDDFDLENISDDSLSKEYNKQKAELYKGCQVKHWNINTESSFNSL